MKSLNETLWTDSFSGQAVVDAGCCVKVSVGISATPSEDSTGESN